MRFNVGELGFEVELSREVFLGRLAFNRGLATDGR